MGRYLEKIDSQNKVSYESQIALWIYKASKDKNLQINFNGLIVTETLINDFNNDINNENFIVFFKDIINRNSQLISKMSNNINERPWKYVKPVIWTNNMHNDYLIENLTLSHRFEVFIDCKFKNNGIDIGLYYGREEQHRGECTLGIEIKRDIKSKETGNLYIEYAERHYVYGDWVPSGIFKKDNTKYFLIGDIDEFWILDKEELNQLYDRINNNQGLFNGCKMVGAKRGTSLGFIIPKSVANEMTITFDKLLDRFI